MPAGRQRSDPSRTRRGSRTVGRLEDEVWPELEPGPDGLSEDDGWPGARAAGDPEGEGSLGPEPGLSGPPEAEGWPELGLSGAPEGEGPPGPGSLGATDGEGQPRSKGAGRRRAGGKPSEPNPSEPNPSEPNLAEPNLAEPNLAEPNLADDPEAVARQVCLRLLTAAPRTRSQLAGALGRRGVPEDVAEAVLDRFSEVGLINDPVFAKAWVESRHHSRGLSRSALSVELHRRGVADEDVRDAIETLDAEQEVATARNLIASKLRSTRGQPPANRMRRLMGVLARKGYGAALAYRVVREALESEGAQLAEAEAEPDPEMDLANPDW